MRSQTKLKYNFDILAKVLEESGCEIYIKKNELRARKFPFHFIFSSIPGGMVIKYNLDIKTIAGHAIRRKNTCQELKKEYVRILRSYKLRRFSYS